jgi:hypothetical protein
MHDVALKLCFRSGFCLHNGSLPWVFLVLTLTSEIQDNLRTSHWCALTPKISCKWKHNRPTGIYGLLLLQEKQFTDRYLPHYWNVTCNFVFFRFVLVAAARLLYINVFVAGFRHFQFCLTQKLMICKM